MAVLFSRILLPFDGSGPSSESLDYAIRLAACSKASLLIMAVLTPPPAAVEFGLTYDVTDTERWNEETRLRDAFKEHLRTMPASCVEAAGRTRFKVAVGFPAEEIVAAAEREEVDLIVMGTHGRRGLARVIAGSVTEDVLHRTRCPVLVLHAGSQKAVASREQLRARPASGII